MITTDKKLSGNGHNSAAKTIQGGLQLLPLIMNNIPQAVFWKDHNLVYLGCNQAFAEDAGLSSPDEIIGKTDFDMPWKEQADLYRADDRLVMESGIAKLNYEEPQTTPDGSRTWLLTNKIPVQENGEIVAVLGMYEDITKRKQAEALLLQSEATLSSMLRVAQMGHWEFDIRTQMFTLNDQYYSLHGKTAQEVGGYQIGIQRFAQEFVYPEDGQVVGQATQQAIETTDPNFQIRTETRILHADGKPRWVSVWFRIEKDADGQTIKLHGVNQDITERKQAEIELQQEKSLSDAIINGLPGVFYLFDVEGKLIRWNKQYEIVLGYTTEETATRNAIDPIADEHKERTFAAIQHAFTEGQGTVEADLVTKNGQRIPYYFVGQRLQIGDQLYLAGTGIDITERKQLQAQVQEAFERRGLQVQLSTQVSQSIAAASSLEELYERVVTQVKEQFGYYHTQLLRYDPAQDTVMLVTGYGEVGAKMLASGHRLPMGEGLIGTAAATGETVLRPVLENDPDWHPNPLLPETKGEIAVPIKLGDTILGVLDVQSNMAGILDADDQLLLEGLCGQIATAIDSTRLRQEMTERLEEINRLYRAMSHEGWQTYKEKTDIPSSFMFDQGVIKPVHKDGLIEELFAKVPLTVPGGEAIGTLAIADDPQRPISPDDQTFVEQVAEQVALALESARLFEQTQSALAITQESETKLSEALHIAKLAHWEFDVERDIFTFNDNFYSIFRTTVEEAGGYELSSAEYAKRFVHPDDAALVGSEIAKALANTDRHFSAGLEHRILYANGEVGYISVEIHLERDENGRIIRWYGANQDITERKRAEETILAEQKRTQTILESVTIPMVITRLSDNHLTFVNGPALAVTQFGYDQVINQPSPNFYANLEDRKKFITELRAKGEVADMVVQLLRANGEVFWALMSAKVFDYQAESSILTTFMDITDRVRAQETVAKRATELATVAQVSTTASTVLDSNELLKSVVELTKERFGLYHAHIYLTDAEQNALVLTAGSGEVGKQMLAEGWSIPVDHELSIIADAYRTRQSVVANDVYHDKESTFLSNRLLPDTRSEMALPLIAGDEVLGVFDVQSDKVNSFTDEDVNIYTTLASQVAVALQNARFFEQVQFALAATQESETRLSEALKIAKLAHWEYDVERDIFTFNDHFFSIFRTSAEQVGGYELSSAQYVQLFVLPEDAPVVGNEIGKAMSSTDRHFSSKLEHRILFANGEQGYIAVEVHVERDETGKITRWHGANQDITERRRAEDAIKAAQQRAQMILETVNVPMVISRLSDGVVLYANRALSEFRHVPLEELIGAHTTDYFFDAADRDRLREILKQQGYVNEFETQLKRRDGTVSSVMLSARVINYQDERAVLTTYVDITDKIRAQEAIAKRATELATVAEVSTTASTVLDPDQLLQSVVDLTKERFGLYHVHIYLANETWDTLLLASGAGEVGRKLVAEQHAIPLSLENSLVARAGRERQAIIINDVNREPGFLPNPLLPETCAEMAVPMTVGNKLLGVFDVQSDNTAGFTDEDANIYITLASQVAVALQNARLYVEQAATVTQLRELDKLKSSFLANMSHELRTPLNSILGFTDVMMEGLDGPLTEYMDNDLRLIQKNGQHLLHLINDVLDMAKIEAGRMNLNPESFKAFEVMEEVTNITSTLASEKTLSLFIDEVADRDITIYADRTRLRQVMINLVNNSIKFTEKGEVCLNVSPMDGGRVLISVRDTGLGIPPEKLEAIFQEFTQVDSSTTRKTGGTGLGLPISRRLVEMHGGRLWADSKGIPGEGSIFFVELPLEARIADVVERQEK